MRWRCCAPMPSICGRPAFPSARNIWSVRWRPIPRSRAAPWTCSRRASIRRWARRYPRSADRLQAIETTIADAIEGVATLDEDRILRRFLNAVRCSLRTNYWLRQGVDLLQARQPRDRRAARAAAAGRDLRLQPAHGGHPSARRPGGARRHPLVRPARGFPHRDPRPDEGADGEERRHRADRLQGRLHVQAPPVGGRASRSRPRASTATRR